jgi:hypoxanthine-guanine phosphoribosyltransferase
MEVGSGCAYQSVAECGCAGFGINFKDEKQKPRYDSPKLLQQINFDFKGKKILLVDDRIKSGAIYCWLKNY